MAWRGTHFELSIVQDNTKCTAETKFNLDEMIRGRVRAKLGTPADTLSVFCAVLAGYCVLRGYLLAVRMPSRALLVQARVSAFAIMSRPSERWAPCTSHFAQPWASVRSGIHHFGLSPRALRFCRSCTRVLRSTSRTLGTAPTTTTSAILACGH